MKQVYLDRLAKVVEAVEALPGEHFNLQTWDCGSHCCAVGAYCRSAQSDGLYLDEGWEEPTDGHDRDWLAVEKHFGLSVTQAEFLFWSQRYPPTKRKGESARRAVVARIRAFINKHSPWKERKIMEHKPIGKVETFAAAADEYREGLRQQLGLSPAQLDSLRNSKLAALERALDPDGSKMDVACGRLLDAVEAAPIPPLPVVNKPSIADKIA